MEQFAKHHFITTNRMMSSKPFSEGFNDARKKLPFKYDKYKTPADEYAYAIGRQFAMSYIGPLKIGRSISVSAEAMMNKLVRSGIII